MSLLKLVLIIVRKKYMHIDVQCTYPHIIPTNLWIILVSVHKTHIYVSNQSTSAAWNIKTLYYYKYNQNIKYFEYHKLMVANCFFNFFCLAFAWCLMPTNSKFYCKGLKKTFIC
jgi:hypothetical protein